MTEVLFFGWEVYEVDFYIPHSTTLYLRGLQRGFYNVLYVGTLVSVCRLCLVKLQAALIVLDWSLSGFWLLQSKRYLDLIWPDKHLPMASKFTSLRMLFCQSGQHAKKSIKLYMRSPIVVDPMMFWLLVQMRYYWAIGVMWKLGPLS